MIRSRSRILTLVLAGSTAAMAGCGSDPPAPVIIPGGAGGGAGGPAGVAGAPVGGAPTAQGGAPSQGGASPAGGATAASPSKCTGACCPSDAACYSTPAGKDGAPGAECMAHRDNTGQARIQMRQTWINPVQPPGIADPKVYSVLNSYTRLPEPSCKLTGPSGYVQLIDFDLSDKTDKTKNVATEGYAAFVANGSAAATSGLCFAQIQNYKESKKLGRLSPSPNDFTLDAAHMSPISGGSGADAWKYPDGLPPPMPQAPNGWNVTPTKAVRLNIAQDFNITDPSTDADFAGKTLREEFLARLDPTNPKGDLGKAGYNAVFYYDEATGRHHAYAPLSWQIIYEPKEQESDPAPRQVLVFPIREAETRSVFTNKDSPNCVGRYRGDELNAAQGCKADDKANPPWKGVVDTTVGEGDATAEGYFLITELEQAYSTVLGATLCVVYPGATTANAAGFGSPADPMCRKSTPPEKWNPAAPDDAGLPTGDWCAAKNAPATATCHDAYRTKTFHGFQAYKIRTDGYCPVF